MTNKFQINIRHQIKSMQNGLIMFSLVFVVLAIGSFFGMFGGLKESLPNFVIFMLVCCLFSLPAIYLHIVYLIDNWGTILIVDKSQDSFLIKTNKGDFEYRYEDVENTELNLGIYYKNQLDNRRRRPAPWANYGYIKVNLKDGKEFLFTSLMMDLHKLPFPVTVTKYRFVPYLRKKS